MQDARRAVVRVTDYFELCCKDIIYYFELVNEHAQLNGMHNIYIGVDILIALVNNSDAYTVKNEW